MNYSSLCNPYKAHGKKTFCRVMLLLDSKLDVSCEELEHQSISKHIKQLQVAAACLFVSMRCAQICANTNETVSLEARQELTFPVANPN